MAGTKAVAMGGGTGLPLVLSCLSSAGFDVSAVVAMADDGGSSGRLRRDLGVLPPGDVRNCLVALAEQGNPLAEVFQYRFPAGEGLAGHAVGNLVLAALQDLRGDFARAVQDAARMLGARGRVLPCTLADTTLHAETESGRAIVGQARIAHSEERVRRVFLDPQDAPAYFPALEAIRHADFVVIGPGSLFTSVVPNLLVAGMTQALNESRGRVVYVCNVANQRGETHGMDAYDHVQALRAHGLDRLDVVVVHDTEASAPAAGIEPVEAGSAVRSRIAAEGIEGVAADVVDASNPRHHDPALLCAALRRLA
ncbi:MAG: YvcK family protein [Coriobacteriia bacterium]|nr:YvcK family protein [Coriobacteriia bacterium]